MIHFYSKITSKSLNFLEKCIFCQKLNTQCCCSEFWNNFGYRELISNTQKSRSQDVHNRKYSIFRPKIYNFRPLIFIFLILETKNAQTRFQMAKTANGRIQKKPLKLIMRHLVATGVKFKLKI